MNTDSRITTIKNNLKERNLKFPKNMELFDDETDVRDVNSIAQRAIISAIMAKCAYDLYEAENQEEIKQNCLQLLEKFNVREHLFASELDVLNKDFDEPLCDTIGWRYEAANALLWSIGLVDDIVSADWPEDVEFELNKVFNLVTTYNTFDDFIAACNLKQEYELQDAFQLYWYYHWNIRDGQIFGNIPESISYDIVMERRRALEWLLYSAESDDGDWEFGMHT
jgi:hypothetical protein